MKENRYGYAFIAPAIGLIILVLGLPMLIVFLTSFTRFKPIFDFTWIGLDNYLSILSRKEFWIATKNTFVFSIFSVVFHLLLGMGTALLLNRKFKGRKIIRILFLLPWLLSYVVGAITWKWMLNGSYGIFNEIILRLGFIDSYRAWLGDPSAAMIFVIVANVWKQFPFVMLMLIAGLQSIPQEQYEAAWMDGANSWKSFLYVTLPYMKTIIIITSTLDFIWSFKQFDLVSVMTGGGPGVSTEILSTLVYRTFYGAFDFGKASAMGLLLLIIVLIVSAFYIRQLFSQSSIE